MTSNLVSRLRAIGKGGEGYELSPDQFQAVDQAADEIERQKRIIAQLLPGILCEGITHWMKPEPPAPAPVVSPDPVNHPAHYTAHPSGVECITVTEHFGFCIGNAIKYLWRAGLKGDAAQDLEKARWYVDREIERRKAHPR